MSEDKYPIEAPNTECHALKNLIYVMISLISYIYVCDISSIIFVLKEVSHEKKMTVFSLDIDIQ